MPKRKRHHITSSSSSKLMAAHAVFMSIMCWQILHGSGQIQNANKKGNKNEQKEHAQNRIPPSIYKWIEENAHICTIVPSNGENLVNFLSAEDGAKCALCPDLGPHELPAMACAVEVNPNDIGVNIGCHPVPDLCVLELKTRYAEFYSMAPLGGKPPGPPGSPPGPIAEPQRTRPEEEIFHASGNLFSSGAGDSNAVPEITVEKEETEETVEDEEETEKQKSKEIVEIKESGRQHQTTRASSSRTTTLKPPPRTTMPANAFVRPKSKGFPLNLTMEEMHFLPRMAMPFPAGPPATKGRFGGVEGEEVPLSPSNNEPIIMKKRIKGPEGGKGVKEQEGQPEDTPPCKDQHELCCFWAMAGECDSNPFWMRTKCPLTCGTCGCKVRNADKCQSVGVKCILPTTTTTTTTLTTTPPTTTTARKKTISLTTPTPPTPSRRRPRPTRPASRPGHRPQRPRTRTPVAATLTTPMPPEVNTDDEQPPYDWDVVSPSNLVTVVVKDGSGGGDGRRPVSGHSGKNATAGRTEEGQRRVDAESRERDGSGKWWLSALGPGYDTDAQPQQQTRTETPPIFDTTTTAITTTTTEPTTPEPTCFNYHKLCSFWAKMGECANNPFWMRPHCQLACESCGETLGDISTPFPRPGGCNNEHILCPFWAFIGECARNPRWMGLNCRASCRLC